MKTKRVGRKRKRNGKLRSRVWSALRLVPGLCGIAIAAELTGLSAFPAAWISQSVEAIAAPSGPSGPTIVMRSENELRTRWQQLAKVRDDIEAGLNDALQARTAAFGVAAGSSAARMASSSKGLRLLPYDSLRSARPELDLGARRDLPAHASSRIFPTKR